MAKKKGTAVPLTYRGKRSTNINKPQHVTTTANKQQNAIRVIIQAGNVTPVRSLISKSNGGIVLSARVVADNKNNNN